VVEHAYSGAKYLRDCKHIDRDGARFRLHQAETPQASADMYMPLETLGMILVN